MSPNMMLKARAAPSGVRRHESVTSHDELWPISFSHSWPKLVDTVFPAALSLPSMAKEYADRAPRPTTMAEAGRRACVESAKAATPAGRARTPLPTHALMRLKVEAEREVLSSSSVAAAPPRRKAATSRLPLLVLGVRLAAAMEALGLTAKLAAPAVEEARARHARRERLTIVKTTTCVKLDLMTELTSGFRFP
jgi:hypothetical protein